jgi:hypothetical protein
MFTTRPLNNILQYVHIKDGDKSCRVGSVVVANWPSEKGGKDDAPGSIAIHERGDGQPKESLLVALSKWKSIYGGRAKRDNVHRFSK